MAYKRRKTRMVRVGNLNIGGDSPISIQSMTTTDTRDAKSTISQIHRLEDVGCDLVRVAVVDMDAAKNIANIKKEINIPIVADIHFDHRLALEAVRSQVDGIRINPGNIGSLAKTKEVVKACKDNNIPIRIG
ncbi:flavodoxin-dependent (E)-4-hydroxy-3-methylbut-2-enyl-diphosphate synthase, partial [Peptostreptococcus sp.]